MTNKQTREIECLRYFALPKTKYINLVHKDLNSVTQKGQVISFKEDQKGLSPEECYFLITDQGQKDIVCNDLAELHSLLNAKMWRLRMMELYEQGVLEGSTPYVTLLGLEKWDTRIPESVMEFMAKTMFQGKDRELIEKTWREGL